MTSIAVVLVTHDADRWLPATLESIERQTRRPDVVIVIDDGSTDGTGAILADHGIVAIPAATTARSVTTRIARNFVQGVRASADADLVALGDHDDIWHEDRIERQADLLESRPAALMVASDGVVIDGAGERTDDGLRRAFPVPAQWDALSTADQLRYALRHSVATGGASMIRPSAFPDLSVPQDWLHDRWWSLIATARGGMIVDAEAVIDYRVQPGQQVGLDAAAQGHGGVTRLATLARHGRRSVRKERDLRRLLRPMALDPEVAGVVSLRNVVSP
jgi:glycosyltransferase involved in cell wall biosynthesis